MHVLFIIDPLPSLKAYKDSSVAMMQALVARGHRLSVAYQPDLFIDEGQVKAVSQAIELLDGADLHSPQWWRSVGDAAEQPLNDFDAVVMRKDPPFDMEFIYTTYILERAEQAGLLVVNKPQGLRDMNEKVYTAWFPQCCAPTLITRHMPDMHAFLAEHGHIVCKPLDGMGGKSIFVIRQGDKNASVVFETLSEQGTRYAIVQKYLPEIAATGDSRILVIDGEPAPYALARIPSADDNRGNLAAGARGEGRELNDRDRWLVSQIGPQLRERGMLFVGLDVIGGFVTEINVTSPTGVRELDRQFGTQIAGLLMDAIARRLAAQDGH